MAEENKTDTTEEVKKSEEGTSGAAVIAEKIGVMADKLDGMAENQEKLEKQLDEAKKPIYPNGPPNGMQGFSVRHGENPMTSRPYSLLMVAKRLRAQGSNNPNWSKIAQPEAELSVDLQKEYYGSSKWDGWDSSSFCVPLGADRMPNDEIILDDGRVVPPISFELQKRCRDMMRWSQPVDLDELAHLGLPVDKTGFSVQKDLSAQTATSGGTFVAEAAQGELINVLRANEMWSSVGADEIDLPPQGSITFPRVTTSLTVAATSEAATVSESTPVTGQLRLVAKPYSSMVDIPEELLRFSSVSVEAWLRNEMAREAALKTDRDGINGGGGKAIQGVINYSGINTRVAGTNGSNGDNLHSEDPIRLFSDIADQNAPVSRGFFYTMTATMWAGLTTAQATTDEFVFSVTTSAISGRRPVKAINGDLVVCTTQVPTDVVEGTASNLTLLLAGVGSEWVVARSGVMDVQMTNSDASKFSQRLSTLRATQYIDMGPRHEESFGIINNLINGTVTA